MPAYITRAASVRVDSIVTRVLRRHNEMSWILLYVLTGVALLWRVSNAQVKFIKLRCFVGSFYSRQHPVPFTCAT